MSKMQEWANNLVVLKDITDKAEFPTTPQGYAARTNACLVQLCLHPDPIVRTAAANLPLLRDSVVVAMYDQEENETIKSLLQVRYDAAFGKEAARKNALEEKDDTIAKLQAKIDAIEKAAKKAAKTSNKNKK